MDYRDNTEILEQLTFSTERKYMAILVRSVLEGKLILYLKGAPEIVFAKCKQVETPAGLVPAQEYHATVEKELLDFQNQAMRTLGFAYKLVDSASEGEIEAIAQEDFYLFRNCGDFRSGTSGCPRCSSQMFECGNRCKDCHRRYSGKPPGNRTGRSEFGNPKIRGTDYHRSRL